MVNLNSIDSNPIVIDNGTFSIKVGFGGEDSPREAFPTILGRKKQDLPLEEQQIVKKIQSYFPFNSPLEFFNSYADVPNYCEYDFDSGNVKRLYIRRAEVLEEFPSEILDLPHLEVLVIRRGELEEVPEKWDGKAADRIVEILLKI